MEPLTLHLLGTGGGRHTMCTQRRKTAGIRLEHGETQIHVDPGPGALVHSIYAGLTPMHLDGVIVTHCHPDHYTDAEVLIEAMTGGTTRRRGVLAAAKSVLRGGDGIDPSISSYHQGLAGRVEELIPGSRFEIGGITFEALRAVHGDGDAICLKLEAPGVGTLAYTSDTETYPGLGEALRDCRMLVLGTMWPRGSPLVGHLCTDDALRLIEEARPRCAVTTHFGIKLLNADPEKEASWLEEQSGVPVVAAVDGMTITLGDAVTVKTPHRGDEPRVIEA
jgi:phosphoribosyl 1,2-cyclic phosphodiesterase